MYNYPKCTESAATSNETGEYFHKRQQSKSNSVTTTEYRVSTAIQIGTELTTTPNETGLPDITKIVINFVQKL